MQIYKYPLNSVPGSLGMSLAIALPVGANIVHVGLQNGQVCLWAEVEDNYTGHETRTILGLGTGWTIPSRTKHLGTIVDDSTGLVVHVREAI